MLDDACAGGDIIIEAVPEQLELKQDVLTRAERESAPTSLLATNTSSLSIRELQQVLARPDRFIGLHFFNPVHINPLLEVVRGPRTGEVTLQQALELANHIGKEVVVVNDS